MDPFSAPSIASIAARTPSPAPRVSHGSAALAYDEVPLADEFDLSMEPAHDATPPAQPSGRSWGWLAPLVFLFGLFVAAAGALMMLLAAMVIGAVIAVVVLAPIGTGNGVEAEYILVPETLPVQGADDAVDAEYILVPETLPVRSERAAPKRSKRSAKPSVPVAPVAPPTGADEVEVEYIEVPETLPAAPSEPEGGRAKVSLEAVPLDDAIRRVQGKAGRGEARTTKGLQ